MEKHIYLVRHGESDSNSGGIMLGSAAMLTDKGKKEAEIVAERIERIGVDALISSSYQRALDTAQAIHERIGLPIEQSDLFIEWERQSSRLGKSWKDPEMKKIDVALLMGYAADDAHVDSDEETFLALRSRAVAALTFLQNHPAEKVCVVSHGIFIRVLFAIAIFGDTFNGTRFERMYHYMRMNNTGVTVLRFGDKEGWYGITWNDSAHLG